jgi:hypothetical protein
MFIPQGDWIVVMRHVRDTSSRGTIVKLGLKEPSARYVAQSRQHPNYNYWAMPGREY